ncbi:MAG: hypothetical protein KGH85_05225 [Thaumarchaeota archaeon]|nr:hypothetical protein [Nitrososphaerota archaeon]
MNRTGSMKSDEHLQKMINPEIDAIIRTFRIESVSSYRLENQLFTVPTPSELPNSNVNDFLHFIRSYISSILYQKYHCRISEIGQFTNSVISAHYNNQDFIESLSGANTGIGSWEFGWQVLKIEKNGQLAVQKDGLTLWAYPQQFRSTSGPDIVGRKGYLGMPKELRHLLPGFYMAYGNAPLNDEPITVRLYWNIEMKGATTLLETITTQLNNENLPFKFKVLNNQNSFLRADAAVLYINKKYLEKAAVSLSRIYKTIQPFLKTPTPLFAKTIAPGVALAEDPDNGESFGQHRSRILAEALTAHLVSLNDSSSGHDHKEITELLIEMEDQTFTTKKISEYFDQAGINICEMYLNRGSSDDYDLILKGVFE